MVRLADDGEERYENIKEDDEKSSSRLMKTQMYSI